MRPRPGSHSNTTGGRLQVFGPCSMPGSDFEFKAMIRFCILGHSGIVIAVTKGTMQSNLQCFENPPTPVKPKEASWQHFRGFCNSGSFTYKLNCRPLGGPYITGLTTGLWVGVLGWVELQRTPGPPPLGWFECRTAPPLKSTSLSMFSKSENQQRADCMTN